MSSEELVATIGLETHVQLKTNSKIWCGCANEAGADPNTHVCPVCMGYPGSLPVLNREAVRFTVITGLLLDCEINRHSKHDRKSYFYPDMPKNYQISQYDEPLCIGGGVDIEVEGVQRRVALTRIHLEEDVGKNTHFEAASGIDYNRAGTPLMEIVTEPDMANEDEVLAYLTALKQILQYGEVSHCNLEEGNIRCDLNISVAPRASDTLGVKAEIKNMNTFKGVYRALKYEIQRQKKVVGEGGTIVQETRRWDDLTGTTSSMRIKESDHDYRYFPDPDLMPIVTTEEEIAALQAALPELPQARRERLVSEYALPAYDADVLVADKAIADYFEQAASQSDNPKGLSNWIMTTVLAALAAADLEIGASNVTPEALAALVKLVDDKVINGSTAKDVFAELFEQGGDPAEIVERRGLAQVSDSGAIEALVAQVIEEQTSSVNDFRNGKQAALQFLVGQVMRLSKGKANPQMAASLIKDKLAD